MAAVTVQLWFVRETDAARLYTKIPPSRNPGKRDEVWLAKSQIEGTVKFPDGRHEVKIPEWMAEKKGIL